MKHFAYMGFEPFPPLSNFFQTAQWDQREGYTLAILGKKMFSENSALL